MRSVASYNPLAARLVGCRFNWTTRRVENQGVRRPLTAELRSQSFETVSLRESLVRCEPLRGFRYRGSRVFGTIACLPQAATGKCCAPAFDFIMRRRAARQKSVFAIRLFRAGQVGFVIVP